MRNLYYNKRSTLSKDRHVASYIVDKCPKKSQKFFLFLFFCFFLSLFTPMKNSLDGSSNPITSTIFYLVDSYPSLQNLFRLHHQVIFFNDSNCDDREPISVNFDCTSIDARVCVDRRKDVRQSTQS